MKTLFTAICIAACLALTACGGGGDSTPTAAGNTQATAPATPAAPAMPANPRTPDTVPTTNIPDVVLSQIAVQSGKSAEYVRAFAANNGWDTDYATYKATYKDLNAYDVFRANEEDVTSSTLRHFYIMRPPVVPYCAWPMTGVYAQSPTARALCALSRWDDGAPIYVVWMADQFLAEFQNGRIEWTGPLEPAHGITQAPYISGLTQAYATSMFLRAYQYTNDKKYLTAAQDTYRWIVAPVSQGGTMTTTIGTWFEQLPTQVPGGESSHILNGHMSALFGIYDYYRVTGDANAKAMFDAGVAAIKANMSWYEVGYWSVYSHLNREDMITAKYMQISAIELLALGRITGDQWFTDLGNRWLCYLCDDTLFVHQMAPLVQ